MRFLPLLMITLASPFVLAKPCAQPNAPATADVSRGVASIGQAGNKKDQLVEDANRVQRQIDRQNAKGAEASSAKDKADARKAKRERQELAQLSEAVDRYITNQPVPQQKALSIALLNYAKHKDRTELNGLVSSFSVKLESVVSKVESAPNLIAWLQRATEPQDPEIRALNKYLKKALDADGTNMDEVIAFLEKRAQNPSPNFVALADNCIPEDPLQKVREPQEEAWTD